MPWTPGEKQLKRKKLQPSVFPSPSGSNVTLLPYSHTQLKTYLELLFLTDQLFGTSLADNKLLLLLHETGTNTLKIKFLYKCKETYADFYAIWLVLMKLFTLNKKKKSQARYPCRCHIVTHYGRKMESSGNRTDYISGVTLFIWSLRPYLKERDGTQ